MLKWGTGGINIDGCRVGTDITTTRRNGNSGGEKYGRDERLGSWKNPQGRFPANFIWTCNEDEYELKDGVNEDDLRKLEKWFENETA